jgi:hypothetical protein
MAHDQSGGGAALEALDKRLLTESEWETTLGAQGGTRFNVTQVCVCVCAWVCVCVCVCLSVSVSVSVSVSLSVSVSVKATLDAQGGTRLKVTQVLCILVLI